jgi:peptidoglycan/LPS O-acetylase OafA/YrhL
MRSPSWYRPESDRYLTLDMLRFLAACAIVTLHYGGQMAWPPAWPIQPHGLRHLQMAVDLFFVISGVMMADLYGDRLAGRSDYLGFLRRRVARLAPLHYATFAIIALAALVPAALHAQRPFDTCGFVSNLLMLQAFGLCDHLSFNTPAWSISAEMGLYIALPAFLWIARRRTLAWAAVAALVAYGVAADARGWLNWIYLTHDGGMLRGAPSFLVGMLLARTASLARVPAPRLLLALCMGLLVWACVTTTPNALRIAIIYGMAALALAVDRQGRAGALIAGLAPLSRLTYSIYMLHHLVGAVLISAVAEKLLGLSGGALNLAIVATAVLAVPAVATLSLVLFEGPLRRCISGGKAWTGAPEPEPRGARP